MRLTATAYIVGVHYFTVKGEAMTIPVKLFISVSQFVIGCVLKVTLGLQFITIKNQIFL